MAIRLWGFERRRLARGALTDAAGAAEELAGIALRRGGTMLTDYFERSAVAVAALVSVVLIALLTERTIQPPAALDVRDRESSLVGA